ncbi:hypothetical protein BTR23_13660 [Alkalihalophilus pseudofirmus]|uniref:PIG-L deacetylase family protein n=1 Tax=Alkalihalobacterium alkalinitrilicum TaxID=427920 RepID=UPI00094C3487|nr:PIG-L deacetylase family protein [Alkalihalobacterium alkalinitrilicum]OLO37176.1 hypothetical protein BTR23_13660 [Alkalihalophilus pseudofirmus]
MLELGQERILIIAPHADDEVLGCGGLIEKACKHGNVVKVVIGAVGDTEFRHNAKKITATTRIKELTDALHYLGCDDFEVMYDDKEALLDTVPQKEIISFLDQYIKDLCPTMVFIPYPSFHQDHRSLFHACMAALRPYPKHEYKLIAMYEYPFIVWQFPKIGDLGELYLDISKTVNKKIEALLKHKSQIREEDHLISPERTKEWARKRGLEIGVDYAEKYYILQARLL